MRLASCFCGSCLSGDVASCSNTIYAGKVQHRLLVAASRTSGEAASGTSGDWDSDCEESSDGGSDEEEMGGVSQQQNRSPSELITAARDTRRPHALDNLCNVVVLAQEGQQCPDQSLYEYLLMRVVEGPRILTEAVVDGWGNTLQEGVEVVGGYFYELALQDGVHLPQEYGLYTYNKRRKALVCTAAVSMVGFTMNVADDHDQPS
jgi:hypothetical protein